MPRFTLNLLGRLVLGAFVAALGLAQPREAVARPSYLVTPDPVVAELSPAYRYANMSDAEAMAELDTRKILYIKVPSVPGVRAPIRLTGRLHGVYFHSSLPPDVRVDSPFEILDARLALTLDDFAAILEQHDIDEVIHYTMYRPNVAPPGERAGASHDHDLPDEVEARRNLSKTAKGKGPAVAEKSKTKTTPAPERAQLPPSKASAKPGGKLERAPKARPKGAGQGAKQKGKTPQSKATTTDTSAPAAAPPPRAANPSGQAAPAPGLAGLAAPPPRSVKRNVPQQARRTPMLSVKGTPREEPRSTAKPPPRKMSWAPPGTRHPAGLAIDVGAMRKRDGTWLSVARHFHGKIGDRTCGPGVRAGDTPEARELRAIVCECADLGIFTYVLTPNYNVAHADHYHMEIKPGVRWFLYY